ncbi:Phosducin domain-containing protein [Entamoeba marina]
MNSQSVEHQLVHGIERKRETTEWQDAVAKVNKEALSATEQQLYDLGNIEYKEQVVEQRNELEDKNLEEIDELLEDDDSDDELQRIKEKRLAEMRALAEKNKFKEVTELTAGEYNTEVTEASKKCIVVVLLYKSGIEGCDVLMTRLNELAFKKRSTKFVKILSHLAIPNYPDKLLPTLIVYKDTNHVKQFIGLAEFGGNNMSCDDLEWALSRVGAVETTLKSDPKAKKRSKFTGGMFSRERSSSEDFSDEE